MKKCTTFVGLDVHKDTISVAIAEQDEGVRHYGEIMNSADAIAKLVKKVAKEAGGAAFCYEAGPCGYGVNRQIRAMGHRCDVVAPSLIPKEAGDRVKTDRRDAVMLARLYRAGELTAVWVPELEQEAMRDLTRLREDMKGMERHTRQRLGGFLLKHGKTYPGKSKWTQQHFRWLETVRFESPIQQIVFQE